MRLIIYSLFCLISTSIFSQIQIGPRQWQDHTGFSKCNTLTRFGNDIVASNGNGLVRVDQTEYTYTRLNKINGLNDVGIKLLRANPYNNKLIVIYENGNIDVIESNYTIKNYPDFKNKLLTGKKIINDVTFSGKFAYLACGFGIVLFDTEKLEIKETYYIGASGSDLDVYQLALTDSLIYAATAKGLYKSNFKTKLLNNYKNWKVDSLPNIALVSAIGSVANVNGRIVTVYSPWKTDNTMYNKDTMFTLVNNVWTKYNYSPNPFYIKKFSYVEGDKLALIDQFGALVQNFTTNKIEVYLTQFNGGVLLPQDCFFGKDNNSNVSYWVADALNGLVQSFGSNPYYAQQSINISGTKINSVGNIDVLNDKVAVAPSYPNTGGGSNFYINGVNTYNENEWKEYTYKDFGNNIIYDINSVYFDRKDKSRFFATSWYSGLLEYKNNQLVSIYNYTNSGLPEAYPGALHCSGMGMDNAGNLWFANSGQKEFLNVLKTNGSIQKFNFSTPKFVRRILVDKNNFVWLTHEADGGITVFNTNNPSEVKTLDKNLGSGNLATNSIYSVAEDKDGKIWIGTAEGIRVFYNPSTIFTSSTPDAQPIKIVQDGNVELLLEKEIITAIAIDGANNKWVGTQNSGVYCFSPDGLKTLYQFTKDNSPLYSNTIIDLKYNIATGDVFIGSELGIQSFRSTIVEGDDTYQNVFAYPNPVKPNYLGTVLVRGLIDNSIVKIVDESGNLVWETKSTGGQIEWNLKTFANNRVQTGVYVVYASTTNGEQRAVTKVLVVN